MLRHSITLLTTGHATHPDLLQPLSVDEGGTAFAITIADRDAMSLWWAGMENAADQAVDDDLGAVILQARGGDFGSGAADVPDVEASLSASGAVGPVYLGEFGPDGELAATSAYGEAGWVNLEDGVYAVDAVHPELRCRGLTGLSSTDGLVDVPVRAGFLTQVSLICE
ncbi:MAG: hypothetical protein EP330_19105 [Deltaproteobacteria bacterium]|nr:MAG: hypothetical protein EP330_19105 [Deltaproteobacteria bacterium]